MQNTSRTLVAIVAAILLLSSGTGYRLLTARIDARAANVTPLNQPLSSVPLELGSWRGKDQPLDERVLNLDGMDDEHLNRVYVNTSTDQSITVYIGYIGRPYRWLVHRPDICFPAHGWQKMSEEEVMVRLSAEGRIPCNLQEFRPVDSLRASTFVLSFFIVNGRYTSDEHVRNASLFAERAPYLTRVQLATTVARDSQQSAPVLYDLLSRLAKPVSAAMPYVVE